MLLHRDTPPTGALHSDAALGDRALRRSQLAGFVDRTLGSAPPDVLAELERDVQWLTLRGGDVLFRQGDAAAAAYIVTSGRVRIIVDDGERACTVHEVGRGETLGEMALLDGGVHSASAVAMRDTDLARISGDTFERLIERHPTLLRRITGVVIRRLRQQNAPRDSSARRLRTIAIVPAGRNRCVDGFGEALVRGLRAHGTAVRIDAAAVDRGIGRVGMAHVSTADAGHTRVLQWLDEQEHDHRFVVYESDATWTAWTERVVRHADHVVFVADVRDDPRPNEIETRLTTRADALHRAPRSLVLVHPTPRNAFSGTRDWLEHRSLDQHFHACCDSASDFARLARMITGRGIGLVLGGGGARGFAHLGVLRALEEVGVPIDLVGGCSIGAVIAAGVALPLSAAECLERAHRHFDRLFDLTMPIVSLLRGRRIGTQIDAAFGKRHIEDLTIPYFCVSTNLTRAREHVHRRGTLAHAIRASIALPGILPPVSDQGDALVDGGLLNNLPSDVMFDVSRGGRVIASDVSPEEDMPSSKRVAEPNPSGWPMLRRRLAPMRRRLPQLNIVSVLKRAAVVGSIAAGYHKGQRNVSLYLQPPVAEWRMLDFESIDALAHHGYAASIDAIAGWWERARSDLDLERIE